MPATTPCVIYVGQTASVAEKSRAGRWVSHLPAEFTVSDLIDALDRAAVFLMDWTARQKMAAAKVSAVVDSAVQAVSKTGEQLNADDQFQLTSWVSLDAPYNTGACVRAMALLTRAPINMNQLCGHSGLDPETARALITSLNRRGVLRQTVHGNNKAAVVMSSNPVQEQVNRGRPVRVGLIQRLTRWVRVGGKS
ncbi:hypothetical protein [Diaphorobacter aerolatus]|uniref:Uncharacterized protein n=1 Tax=Diaphorobacter aerolatus TaxID=1288495 RepID=A0A7H0GH91_9BURK|nr:hypothetical protein [Diaphorobacter aerolatus]QNP47657.1 hypothetical protein H9K75_15735 [Diaphorobacter aerolatus]